MKKSRPGAIGSGICKCTISLLFSPIGRIFAPFEQRFDLGQPRPDDIGDRQIHGLGQGLLELAEADYDVALRRMVHEAGMHGIDAEELAGRLGMSGPGGGPAEEQGGETARQVETDGHGGGA